MFMSLTEGINTGRLETPAEGDTDNALALADLELVCEQLLEIRALKHQQHCSFVGKNFR